MKRYTKAYILVIATVALSTLLYVSYSETSVWSSDAGLDDNPLPEGLFIDSLLVLKSKRQLHAYSHGRLLKTYVIALGRNPIGDKQFEGDNKTPEGLYRLDSKNPSSGYHKNLGVSYPHADDVAAAQLAGKEPGGEIKIHGLPNGLGKIGKLHRKRDWTAGCIAVTDEEIDELYEAVSIGASIVIKP